MSVTPTITSGATKRRYSSEDGGDKLLKKRNLNAESDLISFDKNKSFELTLGRFPIHFPVEELQKRKQELDELLDTGRQNNEPWLQNVHGSSLLEVIPSRDTKNTIEETPNSFAMCETSLNLENSNIISELPEVGCKDTKLKIKIAGDDSRTVPSHEPETNPDDEEAKKAERIKKILDIKNNLAKISSQMGSPEIGSSQTVCLLKAEREKLENICSEMKASYEDSVKRQLIKKIDMSKGPCDSLDEFLCLEENLNCASTMSELVKILISALEEKESTVEEALEIVIKRIMMQHVAESIMDLNNKTFITELKNILEAVLRAMKVKFSQTDALDVIKMWHERWLSN